MASVIMKLQTSRLRYIQSFLLCASKEWWTSVYAKDRIESAGGVEAARGVANERACPQTGVALRRSNPRQRERENERS
jgi:hypothetical protein